MSTNGNDRINGPIRMKNIPVQNLVVVALFLLSLFGNVTESSATVRQASDDQTYFKSSDSHNGPYHDFDHPFGSKGTLPGETSNGEKDSEKEIDDEDGKEYWHRYINKT